MGLDISIYSVESEQKSDCEPFVITDDVEIFEKYFGKKVINTKINQYADFEALGITEDKFKLLAVDCSTPDSIWYFQNIADKSKVSVKKTDVPLKGRVDKVISAKEIGYQRKGMNDLFYQDYTADDYFVFTKERLQFIYDNYVKEERKQHFKETILDKFEEGKTFVTFDW